MDSLVDPKAPMSLGALIAILGWVLTWVLGAIAIRKWIVEERNRRRQDDKHLEELIQKVCKAFTESDAYQLRRDRAMISVAENVTDEAFRIRAGSFVDSGIDNERRVQTERRLVALENGISELRADFKVASVSIAKEVAKELREFAPPAAAERR